MPGDARVESGRMKTEISGLMHILSTTPHGKKQVWIRGEQEPFTVPDELFEATWRLLGSRVRITATTQRVIKSVQQADDAVRPRKSRMK